MKRIFILTCLILSYNLPSFAQSDIRLQRNPIQIDPIHKSFSLKSTVESLKINPIDIKSSFNNYLNHKKSDERLGLQQEQVMTMPHKFDNMPVVKPQGSFSMPIHKPDPTINYTMLIKRIRHE